MKGLMSIAMGLFLLATTLSANAAGEKIAVTLGDGGSLGREGRVGYRKFATNEEIVVTHLGLWEWNGNDFGSRTVSLLDDGLNELASDTLSQANTELDGPENRLADPGVHIGRFRYKPLEPPVTLVAGREYWLRVPLHGAPTCSRQFESTADEITLLDSDIPAGEPHQNGWWGPNFKFVVPDKTPPEVTLSVSPGKLWPPNHKLVVVALTVNVTDNADPNPTTIVTIASSDEDDAEGSGDGKTTGDIEVELDDGSILRSSSETPVVEFDLADLKALKLRAERSGDAEPGRTYTITAVATDADDNESDPASATVVVTHDKSD